MSDVAGECAVGSTGPAIPPFMPESVTGMRAGALGQWGCAGSRFKRTVGVRNQLNWDRTWNHEWQGLEFRVNSTGPKFKLVASSSAAGTQLLVFCSNWWAGWLMDGFMP